MKEALASLIAKVGDDDRFRATRRWKADQRLTGMMRRVPG
jgi:hypothetical protein